MPGLLRALSTAAGTGGAGELPARRPSPFCLQPAPPSHTRRAASARSVPARGEPRPRSPGHPPRKGFRPSEGPIVPSPPLRGPAERQQPAAPPARPGGPGGGGGAAPAAPRPPSPASSSCRHWLKVCSCRSFISPLVRRNLEMKPTAAAISRIMLARVYRAGCMEAAAGGSQLSGAAGAGARRAGTGRGARGAGRDGTGVRGSNWARSGRRSPDHIPGAAASASSSYGRGAAAAAAAATALPAFPAARDEGLYPPSAAFYSRRRPEVAS